MINLKISILKWLDYFIKLKFSNFIKLILNLFFRKKVIFTPQIIKTWHWVYICETLDSILISNKYFEYQLQSKIDEITKTLKKKYHSVEMVNIGAHLWRYSIQYSNDYEKIYAFEPTPKTFKYLSANIELSRKNNIHIYNMWLWNSESQMHFEINKSAESQNKVVSKSNPNTITIDINKFDDLKFTKQNIKFFLIDVEGFEEDVIKWMGDFINNNNDIYIIIEILNNNNLLIISKLLKDFTYTKIDPINYLFIKK